MFGLDHLSKLKKHHFAYKKDKFLLDFRIFGREKLRICIERYIKETPSDYNIGWWQYTNNAIVYSDYYCSKEDAKEIERIVSTMKF